MPPLLTIFGGRLSHVGEAFARLRFIVYLPPFIITHAREVVCFILEISKRVDMHHAVSLGAASDDTRTY